MSKAQRCLSFMCTSDTENSGFVWNAWKMNRFLIFNTFLKANTCLESPFFCPIWLRLSSSNGTPVHPGPALEAASCLVTGRMKAECPGTRACQLAAPWRPAVRPPAWKLSLLWLSSPWGQVREGSQPAAIYQPNVKQLRLGGVCVTR